MRTCFRKAVLFLCTHVFHFFIHTSAEVLIWDHGENYKRIRDSETIEKKLDSLGTSSQHIFNQQTTHRLWCSFITAVPLLQSHLDQAICTSIPPSDGAITIVQQKLHTLHHPFKFLVEINFTFASLYLRVWRSSFFFLVVLSVQNRTCVMAEKRDMYVKRSKF